MVRYLVLAMLAMLTSTSVGAADSRPGSAKPRSQSLAGRQFCVSRRQLLVGQSTSFHVPADVPNYRTHLIVARGQIYDFACEESQRWKDALVPASPSGKAPAFYRAYMSLFAGIKRCSAAPFMALIGKTADDDRKSFAIGSQRKGFRVKEGGELICFANDVKGFYWNNSGAVELSVTRRR